MNFRRSYSQSNIYSNLSKFENIDIQHKNVEGHGNDGKKIC